MLQEDGTGSTAPGHNTCSKRKAVARKTRRKIKLGRGNGLPRGDPKQKHAKMSRNRKGAMIWHFWCRRLRRPGLG